MKPEPTTPRAVKGTIKRPRCFNCIWWNAHRGNRRGECRINPPVVVGDRSGWPETSKTDWCGDYTAITDITRPTKV